MHDPNADARHQISDGVVSNGVMREPWQDGNNLQHEAFYPGTRTPGGKHAQAISYRASDKHSWVKRSKAKKYYPLTHRHCDFTLSESDRHFFSSLCPRRSSCASSRACARTSCLERGRSFCSTLSIWNNCGRLLRAQWSFILPAFEHCVCLMCLADLFSCVLNLWIKSHDKSEKKCFFRKT